MFFTARFGVKLTFRALALRQSKLIMIIIIIIMIIIIIIIVIMIIIIVIIIIIIMIMLMIIIIIIIIIIMVYVEVNQLGGSSPSKTANYNTLIKALKIFYKKEKKFLLLNYNQVTYLYK